MEILQVVGPLVCTHRHSGLYQVSLRVLRDVNGRRVVAVDACGSQPGNWVFVLSGTAGRFACADPTVMTDLTIGGIIDYWDEATGQTGPPVKSE